MYRTDNTANTASFDNKWIEVAPNANNAPLAYVSIETSGDLKVLFPAGHYTPYETSLSGVRARVV
jgi:hypothetical protein